MAMRLGWVGWIRCGGLGGGGRVFGRGWAVARLHDDEPVEDVGDD